jgi:subfamily B ATP-binding cassette protein HlyB/CyaB
MSLQAQTSRPGLDPTTAARSGLDAAVLVLRLNQIAADAAQIAHDAGTRSFDAAAIVRCLRQFGLKARLATIGRDGLDRVPTPVIACFKDGGFTIIGKVQRDRVLIHDPVANQPHVIDRAVFEAAWDGRVIPAVRRAQLFDLSNRFDFGWFLQAMGKYRRLLGEVLIASLVLNILALMSPIFFQVVIDKVLVHRGYSTLDVLMIAFLAVIFFETLLGGFRTHLLTHTTNRIDVALGARLFRHLMALPIGYFASRRTGDSVARVRELENIRAFLTGSALTVVLDLAFALIFVAIMFWYAPTLAWIVVGAFPVYITISAIATPLFQRRLDAQFARGAENQAFLVENVAAAETVKAMAVEPQMQRRWEEQLAGYVTASFRVMTLANWANAGVQLTSKLVTVLTLWLGAHLVIDGMLTVGELVAFNMLAGRVAQPGLRLAQLWQEFQRARLSVDRLGDILNTPPEPQFSPSRATLPPIRGDIRFEQVSFRYRIEGPEVLSNIDLRVAAGETIGVVGQSGSGKSSLAKLIQRLYLPNSGRVLVDGVDLAMVDTAWLRRQIGVVLQESVLFNATVRDNIALCDPGMPIDHVVRAAKLAGSHEFILELPQGYDTVVGERGASLSGGQRQRIAIARALVHDPRILIFDEATSALDYESERIVQQNMAAIAKGRTMFVIAHRLSALRQADRIITIERGCIVEDGTHDGLIAAGGRYAKLWASQAGLAGGARIISTGGAA